MNYVVKTNRKVKVKDFLEVRDTTNFIKYSYNDTKKSLKRSIFVVGVYIDNKPVGVARLVGDGVTSYFVKDLIVIPKYQNNGVGRKLMDELEKYFKKHAINQAYIGLMSTKGNEPFYKKYDFIERPNNNLGSGMVKFYEK